MSAYSVRCPNCGKRLSSTARSCSACGTELPMHVQRIRCNFCGRRVPATSTVCPNCQHNPRGLYFRSRWLMGIAGLAMVGAIVWAAVNAPVWVNALTMRSVPTPTARATTAAIFIVVTSTPPDSPTFAPTPSLAPLDTATSPPTATVTPSPTPTATRRVTRTAPTRTPTATVTATPLPAPLLLAPEDGTRFQGPRRSVVFSFQTDGILNANQWYRVQVDFRDRNDQPTSWCGWSKASPVLLPSDYYGDSWPFDRSFRWHVALVTSATEHPDSCSAPWTSVSAPSTVWIFYWY